MVLFKHNLLFAFLRVYLEFHHHMRMDLYELFELCFLYQNELFLDSVTLDICLK
jgi:hypothetical protein